MCLTKVSQGLVASPRILELHAVVGNSDIALTLTHADVLPAVAVAWLPWLRSWLKDAE